MSTNSSAYMLIFRETAPEHYAAMSADERRERLREWNGWCDRLAAEGVLRSGHPLEDGGRLVTMAGERMRPEGFTEVSGVCTHPDWRGRGYAGALMRAAGARIAAAGDTPFLHVYPENEGAIALYETLGYRRRALLTLTVLAP